MGFLGDPGSKESTCNAGDPGLIPGSGRSPGGEWLPTTGFLPGELHGQRSLVGYGPWGHKESDMTERLHDGAHIHSWLPDPSKGFLLSSLIYFLPFTIAAEFLWLVSLIPGCHLVHGGPPSNFLKCFSSCTVLHSLQIFRKKSNLTPPPHSDPKGQNKRSHYFHWKTPRFFLLLLQYVAFQTLPVLFFCRSKVLLKLCSLRASLLQHFPVILCTGDSFLH